MPFVIDPHVHCANCPYGRCVSYIREASKKMKDRDTQYRLSQNTVTNCAFDSWIPSVAAEAENEKPWDFYVSQVVANGKTAGAYFDSHKAFGVTEMPFFLTAQQEGKVRGDVFEMLVRAVLWNACADEAALNPSRQYIALTLGDNFDLKTLLVPEAAAKFAAYETALKQKDTLLCYSTPDVVAIDITGMDAATRKHFSQRIENLNFGNQTVLNSARSLLMGKIAPHNIVFAAGIKTSIRSDRM